MIHCFKEHFNPEHIICILHRIIIHPCNAWLLLLSFCVFFPPLELHYCTGAYRISPTDVNSRPSSCLTNFLLNGKPGKPSLFFSPISQTTATDWSVGRLLLLFGSTTGRSVLLEQPRKSGSKVISHMLSSHGGEIFLHVLNSNRSTLEDPPSISEGCGGRVTDYRITVRSARSTRTHNKNHSKGWLYLKKKKKLWSISGFWRIYEGEPAHSCFWVFPWSFGEATSRTGQSSAGTPHSILADDHLPDHHLQHAGCEWANTRWSVSNVTASLSSFTPVSVSSCFPPLGGSFGQPDSERDIVRGGPSDLPEDRLQPGGHGEEERPSPHFHRGLQRQRPQEVFILHSKSQLV